MTVVPWSSEKFGPVGRCIYARPGEVHLGPFTDEHIIPFGLLPKGGDWYLPESSCLACADITKRFEDTCLRGMMGVTRAKLDFKTRRKKQRSAPLKVLFKNPDGSDDQREMHHRDLPHYCIGFDWPGPGILRDQPLEIFQFNGKLIVRYLQGELEKHITLGHGMKLGRIRELDFARMLAKIAHVYAYAKCGPDTFEPALLDLILGKSENAPYWVGGDPTGAPPNQPGIAHDIYPIACRVEPAGTNYLLVGIRLFAFWGMPRYHVVIGKQLKQLTLPRQNPPDC